MPISHTLPALVACLVLVFTSPSLAQEQENNDVLSQVSTINALLAGQYQGVASIEELLRGGGFGLGTLQGLDGEMIILDGVARQVRMDGSVHVVPDQETTPWAAVTTFEPDLFLKLNTVTDFKDLEKQLSDALPGKNMFYAIRIEGTFKHVKARSVPGQKMPYPPLAEVVKAQAVFELENKTGTLVGFYCPAMVKGINVVGFHFHFLTEDAQAGGHVLNLTAEDLTASIDVTPTLRLTLPEHGEFQKEDLTKDREAELKKIEN
jgi:acetolactate decarboxylase